jgi:hypothetical protein
MEDDRGIRWSEKDANVDVLVAVMAKGWAEDVSVNKFASRMNLEQKSDPIVPKSLPRSQSQNSRGWHAQDYPRNARVDLGYVLERI